MPPLELAAVASKSDAGGQDVKKKKKKDAAGTSLVSSLEPFPKGDDLGPDMPDETKAAMNEAALHIKAFSKSIQKLGNTVEPGFTVSFFCCVLPYWISCVDLAYSSSPRD